MKTLSGRRIAVLMGGPGSERDVSFATGRGVASALRSLGAEITEVDVKDGRGSFARYKLLSLPFYLLGQLHRLLGIVQ